MESHGKVLGPITRPKPNSTTKFPKFPNLYNNGHLPPQVGKQPVSETDWQAISERLNSHLAQKHLSSHDVAIKAGVDRKTVDRLRAGQAVRPTTLQWIAQALKVELEQPTNQQDADLSPLSFGGYRKQAVIDYVGDYTAYRRSFDSARRIIASALQIAWDESVPALRFHEDQLNRNRRGKAYEYHFGGDILIPPNLGVMHFVVRSDDGRIRLISTSMPRDEDDTLLVKGFLMTLNEIRDIGYYPVTSPICFVKTRPGETPVTGALEPEDPRHAWADEVLGDIEAKYLPGGG